MAMDKRLSFIRLQTPRLMIRNLNPRLALVVLAAVALFGHGASASFGVGIHYLQHPENNGDSGPSEKNIPVWYPTDLPAGSHKSFSFGGIFPNASASLDIPLSSKGPFSAVVLSGGVAMQIEAYYAYAEALAQRGFVVVGAKPYYELFSQNIWREETRNETHFGYAYLIFLRQRALTQALDVLLSASNGSNVDVILGNATSSFKKFVAVGHSLGAAASLSVGGLSIRSCLPSPIALDDEAEQKYWVSSELCQKYLKLANLSSSGPYSFTDHRFSAVVALDPPPLVRYNLPEGAGKSSIYTTDSVRAFELPVFWLTVTGSLYSDNVLDAFDFFGSPDHRGIVVGRNLTEGVFFDECSLASAKNETAPDDCSSHNKEVLDETQALFVTLSSAFASTFTNCTKTVKIYDWADSVNVTFVAHSDLVGLQGYSCYLPPPPPINYRPPVPHHPVVSSAPRGVTYLHHPLNPQPMKENETSIYNIPVWYPQSESDERDDSFDFHGLFPAATAVLHAKPSTNGPFPLALLIPDFGEYPESYYETAETLAASGFVVVGVKPFYELFYQSEWAPIIRDDPNGFAYFTYLRPASISRALSVVYNATSGVRKNNPLRGLLDMNKPVVLVGHGLGAVSALASAGMTLVPCASQPFPASNGVSHVWSNATTCKLFLEKGGLPDSVPLNVSQFSFGPVAALEPGASLTYFDSASGKNYSWFTPESFSKHYTSPLLILSMTGSGYDAEASKSGFSLFSAAIAKAFVQLHNGSSDTFFSECELAAFYPSRYTADGVFCHSNPQPPIADLQHEAALYISMFANYTTRCEKNPVWSEEAHADLIAEKVITGFEKISCPSKEGLSQLAIILIICGAAAFLFVIVFAVALLAGRTVEEQKRINRGAKRVSRGMESVIEGGSGAESADEAESLLTGSSSSSA